MFVLGEGRRARGASRGREREGGDGRGRERESKREGKRNRDRDRDRDRNRDRERDLIQPLERFVVLACLIEVRVVDQHDGIVEMEHLNCAAIIMSARVYKHTMERHASPTSELSTTCYQAKDRTQEIARARARGKRRQRE